MMRGTTTSTAGSFMSKSMQKRPATAGNKNISTGARRQGDQLAGVRGTIGTNLAGPFLGRRR